MCSARGATSLRAKPRAESRAISAMSPSRNPLLAPRVRIISRPISRTRGLVLGARMAARTSAERRSARARPRNAEVVLVRLDRGRDLAAISPAKTPPWHRSSRRRGRRPEAPGEAASASAARPPSPHRPRVRRGPGARRSLPVCVAFFARRSPRRRRPAWRARWSCLGVHDRGELNTGRTGRPARERAERLTPPGHLSCSSRTFFEGDSRIMLIRRSGFSAPDRWPRHRAAAARAGLRHHHGGRPRRARRRAEVEGREVSCRRNVEEGEARTRPTWAPCSTGQVDHASARPGERRSADRVHRRELRSSASTSRDSTDRGEGRRDLRDQHLHLTVAELAASTKRAPSSSASTSSTPSTR